MQASDFKSKNVDFDCLVFCKFYLKFPKLHKFRKKKSLNAEFFKVKFNLVKITNLIFKNLI